MELLIPIVMLCVLNNLPTLSAVNQGDCVSVTTGHVARISTPGVDCGNLDILELGSYMLTTIPTGLFDGMSSLTALFLNDNQLTTIPDGLFDHLSSLQYLFLNNNQLTSLPHGIFTNLVNLKYLHLENNALETLPSGVFQGLSKLLDLFLDDNKLATLPAVPFDGLLSLQSLHLEKNKLTSIPSGIFSNVGSGTFESIFLNHNNFESFDVGTFDLNSLRHLYIYSNKLITLPTLNAPKLEILDASENQISWLNPDIFQSLEKLLSVDLSANKLVWIPNNIFVRSFSTLAAFKFSGNPLICNPTLQYGLPLPSRFNCPVSCNPGSFVNVDHRVPGANPFVPYLSCDSCPAGTYSVLPGSACALCDAGTFSTAIGADTYSCVKCMQGKYSTNLGALGNWTCLNCSAGTYSLVRGANDSSLCFPCNAGSYSTEMGAKQSSACQPCTPGESALPGKTTCTACAQGTYAGSSESSSCAVCSAGTFSDATRSTACKSCPSGTFSSALGATGQQTCLNCSVGSFSPKIGANDTSFCLACASGKYSIVVAATYEGVCIPCSAGKFALAGKSSCTACAPGSFVATSGSSTCTLCGPGRFSTAVGQLEGCTACSPGTYFAGQGGNNEEVCRLCSGGLYSSSSAATDASSCAQCEVGTFSASGYSTCQLCQLGTYGIANGSSYCTICPTGTTTLMQGRWSSGNCLSTSSTVTITMQVLMAITREDFLPRQDAYRAAVGTTAGVDASLVTVLNVTEAARRQMLRSVQVSTSLIGGPAAADQLNRPGALNSNLAAKGLPDGTITAFSVTNNTGQQQNQADSGFSTRTVGIIVGCVVGGAVLILAGAGLFTWSRLHKDPYPLYKEERHQLTEAARTAEAIEKASSKLCEEAYELKTGQPVQAARGLGNLLSVNEGDLHVLIAKGVDGIMMEVRLLAERGGDDEREVLELAQYILYEKSSEKMYPNGIRDKGRDGVDFSYFTTHDKAQDAHLKPAEILALRLYTTAAYRLMNNPLRDQKRYEEKRPCPLPVTTYFAVEGIKKLRANNIKKKGEGGEAITLWRGMRNLKVAEHFMEEGGTELAFMSTTTNSEVAVRYSLSAHSLLFKIVVPSFMQTGADIQWLSAFPGEAEMLYPPLTYLRPTGRTEDVEVTRPDGATVRFHVVEVTPTIA